MKKGLTVLVTAFAVVLGVIIGLSEAENKKYTYKM